MTTRTAFRRSAVAAVAAVATALLAACGSASPGPATATLAGSETARSSAAPAPEIAPEPTGSTPTAGRPWDTAVSDACAARLGPGFSEVAQTSDDDGVTSFWSAGRRWAVCDVAGEGAPLLIESGRGRAAFDEESLALSSTVVGAGAKAAVRFVAGGPLPWAVDELSYTFPDGHVEPARFVKGEGATERTWWTVAYTVTDGPLADPGTDPADLEPATITISGAAAEAFRLPWEDLQRSE